MKNEVLFKNLFDYSNQSIFSIRKFVLNFLMVGFFLYSLPIKVLDKMAVKLTLFLYLIIMEIEFQVRT